MGIWNVVNNKPNARPNGIDDNLHAQWNWEFMDKPFGNIEQIGSKKLIFFSDNVIRLSCAMAACVILIAQLHMSPKANAFVRINEAINRFLCP